MTPTQPAPLDDAGAMAVLERAGRQGCACADCGHAKRAAEMRAARAHLAARLAELTAENDRAWTAANRAEAKVRGWEATMVCTGLPLRACPVDGWGPGADGTVEVPQLTTEKLTSILDRLARAEAELAEVRAALETARDYVTTALSQEREAFKGYEHCSDIDTIEADLAAIDAARGEGR